MAIEAYESPDGILTLAIDTADDGEVCIGFQQSSWHTHPSLLVGDFGQTEEVALQAFRDGILNSSLVIAVVRVGDDIVSTFVTDTPGSEHACIDAGETLELRYWNGQPWSGQGDGHA